jgi:drug/metabolite transporter (DMT)-like permease
MQLVAPRNQKLTNVLSLCVFTAMLAAGQVLFKHVGLSIRGLPPAGALFRIAADPLFYAALILYGAATLLWIWILSRVPLSQAYPWVSVGVFLVPLLGWWFFGERPGAIFWLGALVIICGVILTQYGSQGG